MTLIRLVAGPSVQDFVVKLCLFQLFIRHGSALTQRVQESDTRRCLNDHSSSLDVNAKVEQVVASKHVETNNSLVYTSYLTPGVLAVYAPGKDTNDVGSLVPEPVTWIWMHEG